MGFAVNSQIQLSRERQHRRGTELGDQVYFVVPVPQWAKQGNLFCRVDILGIFLCNFFSQSRADVYVGISPDFTSVKTELHWSQVGFPECILYSYNPKVTT